MAFTLSPGITFCESGGRRIFLDLPKDRYFCLGDDADRAFGMLVTGGPLSPADTDRLEMLRRGGMLQASDESGPPRPCGPGTIISSPLDDEDYPGLGLPDIMLAAMRLQQSKRALRRRPLDRLCREFSGAKAGLSSGQRCWDAQALLRLTFAFQASGRLVGALDQCLALSFAIARRAVEQGFPADLFLGVRLRPFQAHAWVTADAMLISDRLHIVRQFTPILKL